ncbi:MAG: hypothetical protein ACREWG_07610, partial [Gammaproteobacteria bacterium]
PWSGDFEVMRVAKQTDNASLETETDGYTQVDLGVGYTFGTKPADLTLTLRGTNLLDEEGRRHTSFLKDLAPSPAAESCSPCARPSDRGYRNFKGLFR